MNSKINTEKIWDQFSDQLKPFILKRVKDEEISDDILQDTFIKVHQKIDSLRDVDKIGSWVFSIARNTINDHFRKKPNHQYGEQDLANESDEEFRPQGFEECLVPFINCLSPIYKEALEITELQGFSQKEYAEMVGISYPGAKSRVQRAKAELKKLFVRCCNPKADAYGNIVQKDEVEGCPC